jgi:hypothetical protein
VSKDVDTQMMLDLMDSGMTEAEAYAEMKKRKEAKEPPTGAVRPTFPPKKAKPVVKTARAGGVMRSIDGIAQRGKTRAKR